MTSVFSQNLTSFCYFSISLTLITDETLFLRQIIFHATRFVQLLSLALLGTLHVITSVVTNQTTALPVACVKVRLHGPIPADTGLAVWKSTNSFSVFIIYSGFG